MKKVLNYKVEKEDWKKAQDKAFHKFNNTARTDVFRPGKAPNIGFAKPSNDTMWAYTFYMDAITSAASVSRPFWRTTAIKDGPPASV